MSYFPFHFTLDHSASPYGNVQKGSNHDPKMSRHFEPMTLRHHQTGAEMSGQFGTSA